MKKLAVNRELSSDNNDKNTNGNDSEENLAELKKDNDKDKYGPELAIESWNR